MPFRSATSSITSRARRRATAVALLVAAFAPLAAIAADAFPSHPITLVVPFAPGGTTDIIGRLVGQKLGEVMKQPVVIDTRAGAGGTIAGNYVAHAAPDVYTLLLKTIAHSIAPVI